LLIVQVDASDLTSMSTVVDISSLELYLAYEEVRTERQVSHVAQTDICMPQTQQLYVVMV